MNAKEGQLLPKSDPETNGDLVIFLKQVMRDHLEKIGDGSEVIARGHLSQLDTISLTEKLTHKVGFLRTIGAERSLKLANLLDEIAQTETKIFEEIVNRPQKLAKAYAKLLREIVDDLYYIEKIQLQREKLRHNYVSERRSWALDQAFKLIDAYEKISPARAVKVRLKFDLALDEFDAEFDRVKMDQSLNEGEKQSRYDQMLHKLKVSVDML